MKKIVVSLILALYGLSLCVAAPVSQSRARAVASGVLGTSGSVPRMVVDARTAGNLPASGSPAYYIFDKSDSGFVIVSGDDCLAPVLAYSTNGRINPARMPSNLKFWLSRVEEAVALLRKYGIKADESVSRLWNSDASQAPGGTLLELPEWDQENPYNWYCPIISPYESERSMTGCVATAISMVMRYHKWPPCGKGTLPDYNMVYYVNDSKTTRIPMSGHELGHEYKWDLMPMEDFYSETIQEPTEGEKQVAWLMWDCGIMMEAEYSSEGTGAYSEDIPEAMSKYMYYKQSDYVMRDNYAGDWGEMLKGQIDKGLPVLYGGNSQDGGHQFIIHGYDGASNFYVNWGWGGYYNGYFDIDYLYPYKDADLSAYGYSEAEIQEIKDSFNFADQHDAIINLEPDRSTTPVPVEAEEPEQDQGGSGEVLPDLYLKAGSVGVYDYSGVFLSSGSTILPGGTFLLNGGLIYNSTSKKYTGYFRFDQVDWQGKYVGTLGKYDKSKSANANGGFTYVYDISCTAKYDFYLGDKIGLFTSKTSNGVFVNVPALADGVTVESIPLIPMYFIDPAGSGKLINSLEKYTDVQWTKDDKTEKAVITYADGSKETIVRAI